jgi:hypothetical protein
MLRYGLFRLGQAWCLITEDGARLEFPDRASAIVAASVILDAHRACGGAAVLLAQDEFGALTVLDHPPAVDEGRPPQAVPYDRLIRPTPRPRPQLVHPPMRADAGDRRMGAGSRAAS